MGRSEENFYQFNIKIIIYLIVVLVIVGMLNLFVGNILVITGISAFLMSLHRCVKSAGLFFLLQLLLVLFLTIWLSGITWEGKYITPLFMEKLILGFYNSPGGLDTFFHMSIAQMIKTYNIPSTGLDELPYFPYHYGSHFLFAQISLSCAILER